jgi:hypothetical protein
MKYVESRLMLGDCREELKKLPDHSIDLIFTSPPYADSRKNTYGGVSPDRYVEWFLPISAELLRVLKPTGTFVLNIKEKVVNGERHTYVIELILEMRKQGWLWTEEFIWHKKNSYPGKWPNRFRDSWERLLQFNKSRQFHMYQEEVMVPMGDWAERRLKNLSETDKVRDPSRAGSGFGKRIANWIGREKAYPTNVLHMATETRNKNHSAVFQKICLNGLSSCSPKRATGCWTPLWVQARQFLWLNSWNATRLALRFCQNTSGWLKAK